MKLPRRQRGFTLIELVMVIVIMGVIGGMVAVFMRSPIDAYLASARRAALTDVADTTLRRMARDIRKALPNSVRQSIGPAAPNSQCIEFIPTRTGGRYRTESLTPGGDESLDFGKIDTTFNLLGNNNALPASQRIVAMDRIAVYNLGIPDSNAYSVDKTAVVSGVTPGTETTITLNPGKQFALASGSNRFHVIPWDEQVVSYVCNGANELRRTVSTLAAASGTSCPTTGAVMASRVGSCTFVYNGSDLQRNAMVQITLRFTDSSGESVSLYHEVHVDNTP
jgi:MSHA biogenesis protein MshO